MERKFETKAQAQAWARRMFGPHAIEGSHWSIMQVGPGRFYISHQGRLTDEEFDMLWQKAEDGLEFDASELLKINKAGEEQNTPETDGSGDGSATEDQTGDGPDGEPEEENETMAKASTKPAGGPPKKGAAKEVTPSNAAQAKHDKAAAAKALKEAKAKAAAEKKAEREAAKAAKAAAPKPDPKPRELSEKMAALLVLATGKDGLSHAKIVEITGMDNPPQTQLIERLRKHVGGTVRKEKAPEGQRGSIYFIDMPKAGAAAE